MTPATLSPNAALVGALAASVAHAPERPFRAVVAISIGNALEWFDIVIYGFLAATMSRLFFPAANETSALLIALGTFGVTFVIRPLGALALGVLADRAGRKKALGVSIGMMLAGTLMLATAPTYAQAGLASPIIVIVARLVQGFAAGGEFGGATALLAELDTRRRGYYTSWQFASQGLTTLLAASFGFGINEFLTSAQLASWGWRIPFAFGLLLAPTGLYLRRHLAESTGFVRSEPLRQPARALLAEDAGRVATAGGLVVLATILAYTGLFMPTYAARQLGLPPSTGFVGTWVLGLVQLALVPCFGALSDRVGRLRVMSVAALASLVMVVPAFAFLAQRPTVSSLVLVQAALGVAATAYWGPLSAAMSEMFPLRTRGTGLSISYSVAVAVFGGSAPFINAWLIVASGSPIAPAYYVVFGALLSLLALRFARGYGVR